MLKAKAGKAQNWLPSQVAYGVDTSDPDPANWKPFGYLADEADEAAAAASAPKASTAGQPKQ